jgi:hypothetical protein
LALFFRFLSGLYVRAAAFRTGQSAGLHASSQDTQETVRRLWVVTELGGAAAVGDFPGI